MQPQLHVMKSAAVSIRIFYLAVPPPRSATLPNSKAFIQIGYIYNPYSTYIYNPYSNCQLSTVVPKRENIGKCCEDAVCFLLTCALLNMLKSDKA